ncbi:MAG: transcription-repair coupling factor [Betaproteobacteria bacterium]|nr:transcription-repair coupling factor [Betaproteobacteria bacterium]
MPTAPTDAATAAAASSPAAREPAAAPATTPTADPFAALPALVPALPEAGRRIAPPALAGSADALALAQVALDARDRHRCLAIVCAEAHAAARLADEIAWFAPQLRLSVFPDWETLPYDHFSPHQDLVSQRLATLYRVTRGECDVVLVAAQTALYRLSPPSFLAAHTFFLTQGERLDVEALRSQLGLAGYTHVTQVVSPGEFSIRGGLIDLFPMGSALPYRLDLFGDDIESIKTFDVDSQRTLFPVRELRLLPAREFPLDDAGRTRFRGRFREVFEGDPSRSVLYTDISAGIVPGGIEYYLPLFFDATATFVDYLPPCAVLATHGDVQGAVERFWQDTESRYRLLRGDKGRPLLPPTQLFLPQDEWNGAIKGYARLAVAPADAQAALPPDAPTRRLPSVQVDRRADDPLAALRGVVAMLEGRMLIAAESPGRRETMQQYFAEYGMRPAIVESFAEFVATDARLALAASPLQAGFAWPAAGLAFVTEAELYANVVRHGKRETARRSNVDAMVRDLSEMRIGDPVVHEEHGIGRYLGLVTLDVGDGATEFLELKYANDAKLYVPVSNLHVISRYSGAAPDAAPLHELGSGQWEKAKRKAAQQAHDTAAELLNLYAQRAAREGHVFSFKPHDYEAFAEGFGFEETADQKAAIEAVIADLTSGQPMDRLVCGDVGFGKTEVALRAAFIALADGRQVAVLVPTTLLAEQHFQVFSDRFADWPVKLAELSRFRSGKEVRAVLDGLAAGSVDLVIGTHKLIQPDVKFKNLGLVIIDEEHRFGVRQKEQLKRLRAEVDVLTLTATPIPRTLAMSLEGIRDFSVIATAPQRRLAIKTFVAPFSTGIIREAALRELKRGGQIYFLHNDIDTIRTTAERLAALVPEARIALAHGQLAERELEHVMRDFYAQRVNLLVCSTIIETGIDVPTANTIIIDRADRFGLAQLHQLRGRVGRSHHQAYAYLLTPPQEALSAQAKKRLEAIQMMEDLGSGFFLAMHDLEIRGAGEVLGDEQSGEMQQIGFQLYADMLKTAVAALRSGREPDLSQPLGVTTEINLHVAARLPQAYCSDVHERLVLYKRLASCESVAELDLLREELVDRFGPTPEPAQALVACHRLRLAARPLGVVKVDAGPERTTLQFVKEPPFDTGRLILLIQKDGRVRFAGPDRIRIERAAPALSDRVALVRDFLARLD